MTIITTNEHPDSNSHRFAFRPIQITSIDVAGTRKLIHTRNPDSTPVQIPADIYVDANRYTIANPNAVTMFAIIAI